MAGCSLGSILRLSVEGALGSKTGQREESSCDWVPTEDSATGGAEGGLCSLLSTNHWMKPASRRRCDPGKAILFG